MGLVETSPFTNGLGTASSSTGGDGCCFTIGAGEASDSSGIAEGRLESSCQPGGGLGGGGALLLPRDAKETLDVETTAVRLVVGGST